MSSPPPATPEAAGPPSLTRRISIAFGAFFAALGDADVAARVAAARSAPPTAAPPAPPPPPSLKTTDPDAALQLLALLQREARLVDFVGESLAGYTDAQIGAAARLVHEGCGKVLREHFDIVPVRDESEGSQVTLPAGFDAAAVRLTGNVVGAPPFKGQLSHRGWRVAASRLPQVAEGHDTRLLAPAEVEL